MKGLEMGKQTKIAKLLSLAILTAAFICKTITENVLTLEATDLTSITQGWLSLTEKQRDIQKCSYKALGCSSCYHTKKVLLESKIQKRLDSLSSIRSKFMMKRYWNGLSISSHHIYCWRCRAAWGSFHLPLEQLPLSWKVKWKLFLPVIITMTLWKRTKGESKSFVVLEFSLGRTAFCSNSNADGVVVELKLLLVGTTTWLILKRKNFSAIIHSFHFFRVFFL